MKKEELIKLIDMFINDAGLWPQFKTFVESQGYTLNYLGFREE